jgi:crotonobetainyl-CoA:carnitine CoA-transferase CaiB-like acyl-CoA transferase
VQTEEDWKNFCKVIGDPLWTKDPKFHTLTDRKKNEEELNRLIEAWTIGREAGDIQTSMQAAGIPAGVVKTSEDLFSDPQLRHRHHFWRVTHQEIGEHYCEGISFVLSKTPGSIWKDGPCLGQDSMYICTEFLGMSEEEFGVLAAEGVFV